MELLFSASIIAAFIAGIAALFAPCCITVLLPSYFASIFREKRELFFMTFIFFLGILAVFLPIGLGAAILGQIFSRYHNAIFGIGGFSLVLLGFFILTGKHFSLPFRANHALQKHNAVSVFSLGVFSGVATTCCAPVLAGVLALAAIPGSIFWGGIYTLSYVLGIVAPLFLISFFLDKIDFTKKFQVLHKLFEYSIGHRKVSVTFAEIISGVTFLAMGILILYLALINQLFMQAGGYQTDINIYLTKVFQSISGFTQMIPEYAWALIFIVFMIFIIKWSIKQFLKEKNEEK